MESKRQYLLSPLAMCMCLILAHYVSGGTEESTAGNVNHTGITGIADNVPGLPSYAGLTGTALIKSICKARGNEELCLQVLSSTPDSNRADLKDLAMTSLKAAAANATDILVDCKTMIDDPELDPGMQQGLADCKENLLDAEGQIQDAIASILSNDKRDAQLWLKAALAAIDTCDASIPGDDDILSRRSVGFRQLCNIAVAINKAMMLSRT